MKWSSSLLWLAALCASYGGICGRDPHGDQWQDMSELGRQVEEIIRSEMSSGATSEEVLNNLHTSSNEVIQRAGFVAINLANKVQIAITELIASFVESVGNALGELQSFLQKERNTYRSQALQDATGMLTQLNAVILDLEASLERINGQQANNDQWELQTAEEWKLWAAVLVSNVRQSTEGAGTDISKAKNITQGLNTRYGLRLHACQEGFIWAHTRFNLELQETLEIAQNSTDVLIQATVNCQVVGDECRNAVRKALNGIIEVPVQLDRFRDKAEHLLVVIGESNQCLSETLEEYAGQRLKVESQLQDIIEQYGNTVSPETVKE
ncbi:uncharacterized protein [Drosophila pseudoobscura]|uniref:Uncharacterized protein n=1 Tax=Drosophila pseudoobscura pseudoobscura TaxID=46245 RepID=A0A6I8V2U4_DROPS|nr:uncharacterized protein LOC6897278 [Drosophila pseudoobscura]